MYDSVRWIILILLFAGLFGIWLWSRRNAPGKLIRDSKTGRSFQVIQKRWLDQKTGICLVESGKQGFLLAYTVGGGVSWQPVGREIVEEAGKTASPKKHPTGKAPQ